MSFQRLGRECDDADLVAEHGRLPRFCSEERFPAVWLRRLQHPRAALRRFLLSRARALARDLHALHGESAQQYARLSVDPRRSARPALARACAAYRRLLRAPISPRTETSDVSGPPRGALLDARGTNGAYIVWLMAELARMGYSHYLSPARRAAQYFIDTAVIRATFHIRHTGRGMYRQGSGPRASARVPAPPSPDGRDGPCEAAREAASFCLSWQFTWDVPFSPRSPLGALGFHTFGGTAVSVAHHHLDPYGMMIALDFLRLGAAVSESRWETYAHDLMGFCGTDGVHAGKALESWALDFVRLPARAVQSHRLGLHASPPRGQGAYGMAASWVASSTLGAALDIREEFPTQMPRKRTSRPCAARTWRCPLWGSAAALKREERQRPSKNRS